MTVSSSMTDTTHKSPSKLKRDQLRMTEFNLRKLQETFQNEIKKRTSTIFRLEVEISKLKFELSKQKPKLSIKKVINYEIPPQEIVLKPNPSLQQLSTSLTSNTCDTPSCQYRRRPCHALTPASQFYHDFIWWSNGFPLFHLIYCMCTSCTPSILLMYIIVLLIRR